MKKILLSLVAIFAVMTASAKQVLPTTLGIGEDGAVTEWSWNQYDLSGGYWEYTEDKKDSTWISVYDYSDASDYDYVVITFDETTVGGTLWVVAAGWDSNAQIAMTAGATYVACPLTEGSAMADYADNLGALVFQPGAGGGILKIKEVAYMTEDEFEAVKAEEDAKEKVTDISGEFTANMDASFGGWYSPGWVGTVGLAALYKTVVVEIASSNGPCCFKLQGNDDWDAQWGSWSDAGFANTTYYLGTITEPIQIAIPVETIKGGVGQFAFANYNPVSGVYAVDDAGNKIAQDNDQSYDGYQVDWTCAPTKVVLTKIYATSNVVESSAYPTFVPGKDAYPEPSMPDAVASVKAAKSVKSGVMYNLAGQKVSKNYKGVVIQNGVKYNN